MTTVIKRDGRQEAFDANKIRKAIEKSCENLNKKNNQITYICDNTLEHLLPQFEQLTSLKVEDIHESIIGYLSEHFSDIALSYARYYTIREREKAMEMDLTARIARLVNEDKDISNENANKDSRTFSTKRDLMAGQVAKAEGLKSLPIHIREAHLRGDIHYHDLDYHPYLPYTNCCLIDLEYMFENGFNMGNAVIGKPKSIQTAVAQATQIVANVSSSQYGGTSINRIDEILEPYAQMNYDKHIEEAIRFSIPNPEYYAKEKTKKDIYDSMQSLEYEINTLYTANGQTPFTTIGFGLGESWIAREIQSAILTIRLEGLGEDKKTAIFPKLLFTIKKGLNYAPNDINYDIKRLALKCASERMYPDILNYDTIIRLTGSFKASIK